MKEINLSNSYLKFIVDDEDAGKVSIHSWNISDKDGGSYTIKSQINNTTVTLNRYILNYYGDLEIDHKNRNYFDFRKENLRLATGSQNCANRAVPIHNTSGYRGVIWKEKNKKWEAFIGFKGRRIYLGIFSNKEDAARCRDKAAKKYFG